MPTQSVTKSSHYVSVSQTTSGGVSSSRFLTWGVGGRSHFFCSLPGILRIIEILLVLLVLILARVGYQGGQLTFGGVDADFTGIGGSVCLLVILLMFTLSTLIGHLIPNLLEVMTTLVGAVLMITAGALAVSYHSGRYSQRNYYKDSPAGLALGIIAIIAGVFFVVDFILALRKLKVSIG